MLSPARYVPVFLLILSFSLIPDAWGISDAGPLDQTGANCREAVLNIRVSDFERIEGSIQFSSPHVEAVTTPEGEYDVLNIEGAVPTNRIGLPELPILRRAFQIPSGAQVSLHISTSRERTLSAHDLGVRTRVLPVQPSVPKIEGAEEDMAFAIDESFYGSDLAYPDAAARIVETGRVRGHEYVMVEFYPVRYNPGRGEFTLLSELDFQMNLANSDREATMLDMERYSSAPFEKMLDKFLVNHEEYHPWEEAALPAPLGLLIITPDSFESDLLAFAEWKTDKGLYTTIATLSETGSSNSQIRSYIQNAYNNWAVPPTYVLLMGDTNLIPYFNGLTQGQAADVRYVTVDGTDWLPEMIAARFPFRTRTQLNSMLSKTLDYENLNLPATDYLNRTSFLASNDSWYWQLSEDTHRYVIVNYMVPNGIEFTGVRAHSGGNTQDILDQVNAGRTFVNYSGHGGPFEWSGPAFHQSDIRSLTNQYMYPFVISHACLTGKFDEQECFGETWVREGDKGALAFWGASNTTYWDEDDYLERRMYDLNFTHNFTTIGEMTYAALYMMHLANWGRDHYYFEAYNVLGDPTVDIYMGNPFYGEVTYSLSIYTGPQDFTVDVFDAGEPVVNALVCVMKDTEVYETAYTGSDGIASLSIDPATAGTMGVTITAHNMSPDIGSADVLAPR